MGYKASKNINNKTKPAQNLRQFTQSPSLHNKSPSSFTKRSNTVTKQKSSQISPSYCFSYQFISQIEIISWTIICLVIMLSIDRIGVNGTMFDSRVTTNNDFEMNEWIEDDLIGDSDNQFVEKGDDNIDMDRLQNIIIQGLNLTRIPDVSKVSQKSKLIYGAHGAAISYTQTK